MSSVAEISGPAAPAGEQQARSGSHRVVAVVLAVALVAGLLAAAVVLTRRSAVQAQTSMLADQTVTKAAQELERQAALPADQRSLDAFSWAIATPQSDRTGAGWTTEVGRADLGAATLFADVTATLTAPGRAPSYYLEFVVSTTGGTGSVDSSACVVRSGSADAPVATTALYLTDHLFLPPCSAADLQQRGIRG